MSHATNTNEAPFLLYVDRAEINRIRGKIKNSIQRSRIISKIFRLNALSMIMESGSGHIGSSLSAMDIVTWLWCEEMVNPNDDSKTYSDIYFSSKGHDAPGLYSVMIGTGKLPESMRHHLRKLGGLPGHPDVGTPYVPTNTGPLGMGLAKARGMAGARRLQNKRGRIFVLLGDGELQEGQNWETLQPISNDGYAEIIAIVDNNKIQSDTYVKNVSDLGDLTAKFKAFGWEVSRINGHDMQEIKDALKTTKNSSGKPKIIIADTVKGKGVSFMEKLASDGFYKFHSGAPLPELYTKAAEELVDDIEKELKHFGISLTVRQDTPIPKRAVSTRAERLIVAHGDELLQLGKKHKKIIALDADLVLDTGLIPYSKNIPERYVEAGIAEQYMTSMAGGYALKGMLPIVHSFECFLATHANAQIYNNATEKTKIIYIASLAGILPAAPGHSHQSLRGISLIGSMPGMTIIEPSNEKETRMALRYAVEKNKESTCIRLVTMPTEVPFTLPSGYTLKKGRGVEIKTGEEYVIIAYGPTLLREAFLCAEILERKSIHVSIVNMPWLNFIDEKWFCEEFKNKKHIITLDDHYVWQGLGMQVAALIGRLGIKVKINSFGIQEIPACGTPAEVLAYHGLDARSLAKKISSIIIDSRKAT